MAREMLHSQQGLEIYRNEHNKFVICQLRFDADPAKRSEEWLQESKAGLNPARWAREYDLQWDALDGQKVFPEIVEHKSKIVIPSDSVTFGSHQKFWAGYDHGMRNPSAFIVFTEDESGTLYAIWEMYEPCTNMLAFVAKLKQCPYWNRIRHIVADPALWDKRGYSSEGIPISPYEMFCQYGVRNFVKGNRHVEQTWLMQMRQYWGDKDDIQFKIFDCCPSLVDEFTGARFPNMSDMVASNKNVVESMVDKDNHAMDATKYWMTMHRKLQQNRPKYQSQIYKWLK